MPFIDRIIQFLHAQQGDRIVLESDQNAVLYRGGAGAPQKDRLSFSQINTLLTEVMPDACRSIYASGQPVSFDYSLGNETLTVEVTQNDGSLCVSIGKPGGNGAVPDFVELPPLEVLPDDTHTTAASAPPTHAVFMGLDGEPLETGAPPAAAEAAVAPADTVPAAPVFGADGKRRVQHVDELFRLLKEREGSDLHLSSNEKPIFRVHGKMKKLEEFEVTTAEHCKELLWAIAPERNREEWEKDHDSDFAYEIPGLARFRCNYFADRHGIGAVFRLIPSKIATVKDLNLTQAMVDLCFLSKGLVVVTGPTGSGKSTTLAALVDHINKNRTDHVITIEDPVEFVHEKISCLVTQREVHVHTNSFSRALRAALREDPDIILVGEMRDLETIAIAIETAETGHLVFGTLHTSTAASTVDRIIDQFPADEQEQIRTMLAESLKGVIAQTLCRTADGRRQAAFEILIMDAACANLIREGKTYQLPSMMQIGKDRGCITMNESLLALVKAGKVTAKEAYIKAMDKAGLRQAYEKHMIRLDLTSVE
jgi:twitching motility protein PilT